MIRDYILLAAGSLVVGVLIAFTILAVCQRLGINVFSTGYIWLLAIPVVVAITLNIILLEIYGKFRKKKKK